MSPWYKIPRSGGVPMWLSHERPDLEPAEAPNENPAEPTAEEKPARRASKAPKAGESEAKAD